MVQKQLPALTRLSHTDQRQPSANAGLAQKLNNEQKLTLLLLLLLPLLQAFFYSSKFSGSHHSCTGATINGPNVEGRVWLSPKMSDTNALFMQKAYNALQFLSSEQITLLSASATRFFISDTCFCFFSTSKVRWPGYLHAIFAWVRFLSNAGQLPGTLREWQWHKWRQNPAVLCHLPLWAQQCVIRNFDKEMY